MSAKSMLSGWGRLPLPGRQVLGEDLERVARGMPLTRGLGRSYGDSALPPPGEARVAGSRLADRILSFDPDSCVLRAEAGFSLGELNRIFWPRRFSSPVLTGTQHVTLGGMVAADVHGKNHHRDGTIGSHVRRLKMLLADGRVVECSRESHQDLFLATLGGMGLTGHILEVELVLQRIPSPWIWSEAERMGGLDRFLAGLEQSAAEWPFTVGWVDCLATGRHRGRGLLIRGRWAEPSEAPSEPPAPRKRLVIPVELPSWVLNRLSARTFNLLYYRKQLRRRTSGIAHPESFFHPLDVLIGWNKIYGPRGFTQYACVIPETDGTAGVRRFLGLLTSLGVASFLCVLKDFGGEGEGMLSFPKPGMSLSLDIPVRGNIREMIARLDDCVIDCGGRIYLAKDAFTSAESFRAMEPRLKAWQEVRRRWDPDGRLASAQSIRLLEDRR
ncbi:MAG: FAD-binding oxidoreductase [bacterium]|nr:FAD-binding oxidoreductase [bacterium]